MVGETARRDKIAGRPTFQRMPMDFRFSDDQLSIQSIARDFAQKRIAPVAAELDASGKFPLENIREMGQLGLMGIEVPEEYGGAGMDPVAYALAMIEIGAADTAHSTIMSVNNSLYCNGILQHGTEEQKQKYVRAIAARRAYRRLRTDRAAVGFRCLGHAHAGDRRTRTATGSSTARRAGSPRVRWPSTSSCSRSPTPGIGAKGISAFIIDTARAGFPCRQDRAQARHPRFGHLRDRIPRLRLPGRRHARCRRARASASRWACSMRAASASHRRRSACAARPMRRASPMCRSARRSARRSVRSR